MKKIIGIVAEYNPFHEGHLYHIRESKKAVGEDSAVVCVMSGDFVQRGEWAVFPKHERAAEACRNGADLVLELPLPWCLSSAGYFAVGAVSILKALGMTHLSFGSESGDLNELKRMAALLAEDGLQDEIRSFMRTHPEMNYPTARSAVLGSPLPEQPNNLLAAEYLLAIRDTAVIPMAVQRIGMAHDERGEGAVLSASELRSRILAGEIRAEHIDAEKMDLACVSRLRCLDRAAFDALPDCRDGLGQRLFAAVREKATLEEICAEAKTKRFTLSRVRRAVMCAVLHIREEDRLGRPPYARVLAMNRKGRELLSETGDTAEIPVLTQPKSVFHLGKDAEHIFELGSAAHDLTMLCYPGRASDRCGDDYRNGPVFVG